MIPVGPWRFYPKEMVAQNSHNGTWAIFDCNKNGDWICTCCNCPATWMLEELVKWFDAWIHGEPVPSPSR